ncbi:hypothetical protein NLG97_g10019 [Lecanicillium saksenae]|uniref:Uncharacterized protein n=1 Tax=Lecanicillium saksenae TaxID=468837 RepID=A0ACC1QFP1_9HYPO|nr:hypothetical protein NLG97_g10019 [Lecanicillium saksenae]
MAANIPWKTPHQVRRGHAGVSEVLRRAGTKLYPNSTAGNESLDTMTARRRRLFAEAEPPDWDYLQAIRYFFLIVRPSLAVQRGTQRTPHFQLADALKYITMIITTQLGQVGKSRGHLLRYGDGDGDAAAALWATHTRYLAKVIALVNKHIKLGTLEDKIQAIRWIDHLVLMDLCVESRLWKAHVDGLFAHAVRWDTTTPIRFHTLAYSTCTDEKLEILLSDANFSPDAPFPPRQKVLQIHITRLRRRAWTTSDETLARIIGDIFERLAGIDILRWASEVDGFDSPTNQILAEIHHDALWLYALLSLPRRAMLLWARTQPSLQPSAADDDEYDAYHKLYASRLLSRLRTVYPTLQYPRALDWPLIVGGVVALDNDDREFIDACLYSNWLRPVGFGHIILPLQKLRQFWEKHGRGGWDGCFYEPTPC